MNLALNEIEASAKKATRGAGYSWGMSEEAAKATRWLCLNGIDGVRALAAVLRVTDGAEAENISPVELGAKWQARSGQMCPLIAGVTLSDFAGIGPAEEVTISNLIAPVLLLPFANFSARQLGAKVTVKWGAISATTNGTGLCLDGAMDCLALDKTAEVKIRFLSQIGQLLPHHSRTTPRAADWVTLNRFAQRTYAPATDESRLKGAGAGLSDND